MQTSNRLRFGLWIVCIAGLLLGMPVWFFLLRGSRILNSDTLLFSGWIGLSVLIIAIWWLLKTTPADAIKLKPARSQWIIILGAVWLHANAICWLVPGLSDDVLRYRVDGGMWILHESPYATSPSLLGLHSRYFNFIYTQYEKEEDGRPGHGPLTVARYSPTVSYPAAHTIYLPTSQVAFTLIKYIEAKTVYRDFKVSWTNDTWRDMLTWLPWHEQVIPWRIAFGEMTLITTWLLMRTAIRMGRSPWWAILIGWHPLAIIETSGMAHQDAIGILLLAGAFWAWLPPLPLREGPREGYDAEQESDQHSVEHASQSALTRNVDDIQTSLRKPSHPPPSPSRGEGVIMNYSSLPTRRIDWPTPASGFLLALACGVKPLAIIPAAYWFIAKPSARWVVPFILTILALLSVFLYQDGYIGFLQTLRTYTQTWEANGSFFHFIRTQFNPIWTTRYGIELFIEPWEYARMLGAIIVCALAIGLTWKRARWTTAFYWLVLTSLLVAPVVYPWYLLWVLVIIPILNPRWGLTGLVFAATVTFNYRLWHEPQWVLPWGWLTIEYLPVYLTLIFEVYRAVSTRSKTTAYRHPT